MRIKRAVYRCTHINRSGGVVHIIIQPLQQLPPILFVVLRLNIYDFVVLRRDFFIYNRFEFEIL